MTGVICLRCHGPRVVASQKPGEIAYKPCAFCGEIGILVDRRTEWEVGR